MGRSRTFGVCCDIAVAVFGTARSTHNNVLLVIEVSMQSRRLCTLIPCEPVGLPLRGRILGDVLTCFRIEPNRCVDLSNFLFTPEAATDFLIPLWQFVTNVH